MTGRLQFAAAMLILVTPAVAADSWREISAGARAESLTKGRDNWRAYYLGLQQKTEDDRRWHLRLHSTDRFATHDSLVVVGGYLPAGDRLGIGGEYSHSPTGKILAEHSYTAHVTVSLPRAWNVTAAIRRTNYTDSDVTLGTGTVEKYAGPYRAVYTLFHGRLDGGGSGSSHLVRLDRYYGNYSYVGVAGVYGKEAERIDGGRVLVNDIRAAMLLGEHWWSPRWGVRYAFSRSRQDRFYTRRGVEFGVAYRF